MGSHIVKNSDHQGSETSRLYCICFHRLAWHSLAYMCDVTSVMGIWGAYCTIKTARIMKSLICILIHY
jgi:hypothetical protein